MISHTGYSPWVDSAAPVLARAAQRYVVSRDTCLDGEPRYCEVDRGLCTASGD